MTEEKKYELIEAWLAGELSGKPLQAFEAQLQSDEELALEVEVVRDLSTLNTDTPRNQLRNTLSEIRNTTKEDRAPIPIYWWLRNAAAALVLLVGAIFMINQFSKDDKPELVQEPQLILPTDEDEDGVIDFLDVEDKPEEIKNADLVEKDNEVKTEIDSTPKEQFFDKENEQIEYKLTPQIAERAVIVSPPDVASYVEANTIAVEVAEENIPDYVSNPISNITFYDPEHESTFEEEEADRKTDEEMEAINKMALENIQTDYEVVDGDTIEMLASVASAVIYVADVPERRLNFLLESEKEKLKVENVKLDSLIFDTYYDDGKMLSFKYEGQILKEENSQVGFYIFSPNSYDFLNNEFLFFKKLETDVSANFSIESQIPVPSSEQIDFYLYGVFIDENTQKILAIEKMQIGH